MKAFRIYTQHGCPFCELALSLLKTAIPEKEVEHIEVGDDPVIISGISVLTGTLQTPIIITNIGNEKVMHVVGNDLRKVSDAVTRYLNFSRS